MDKNLLVAALLNDLADTLALFGKHGLAVFARSWNELHAYAGKNVAVFQNGQPQQPGTVTGIDEYGRLILEENSSRMAFSAGDVSLRPF